MKKFFSTLCLISLLFCAVCFGISCAKDEEVSPQMMDISSMTDGELAAFVELGEYRGLTLTHSGKTKSEAIWDEIHSRAKINSYPEQQVEYYFNQARAQYEYYAKEADMSYEDMLAELGLSEDSMLADARRMAIGDVISEMIRRKEQIELTDAEKRTHFDRYAKKYADDYGYSTEYVKENMSELIYESMLRDKVTEFLIIENTFN